MVDLVLPVRRRVTIICLTVTEGHGDPSGEMPVPYPPFVWKHNIGVSLNLCVTIGL